MRRSFAALTCDACAPAAVAFSLRFDGGIPNLGAFPKDLKAATRAIAIHERARPDLPIVSSTTTCEGRSRSTGATVALQPQSSRERARKPRLPSTRALRGLERVQAHRELHLAGRDAVSEEDDAHHH